MFDFGTIKKIYEEQKALRFIGNLLLLYISWKIASLFLNGDHQVADLWLWINQEVADNIVAGTAMLLRWLDYDYHVGTIYGTRHILIKGSAGIVVAFGCVAVPLMVLLTGLIIAFPGKISNKLVFIVIGIFGIHTLNILRVFGLCLYSYHISPYLKNHKMYFNVVTYVFIALIWVIWVNYSTKKTSKAGP